MIYAIPENSNKANQVKSANFVDLGIWERQNIEKWIIDNPDILCDNLLIVSSEFDKFQNSEDRLDILAIDEFGHLVVIELKRSRFAEYADLQAIRYAAMTSTMTIDKLIPYYIKFKKNHFNSNINEELAKDELLNFIKDDDFEELSNRPRVILCSQDFSQEITTTVLWLRQFNVDISCVKITPYKVDKNTILVPQMIIPLDEAKKYLIEIQQKEEIKEENKSPKAGKSMKLLIEKRILKEGDEIFLKNDIPEYMEYKPDDPVYHATITGKTGQSNSVKWKKDDGEYSISNLTWSIFKELHPNKKEPGGVNGNWHWVNRDGRNLWDLAQEARNILDS